MKSRETFTEIRNQKKDRLSLRMRMMVLIQVELIFCTVLAYLLDLVLSDILFPQRDSFFLLIWIVISLILTTFATNYVTRAFLEPYRQLRKAIGKVADGDFSVRLEPKSHSKEINEIMSGFNLMVHELNATEVLQSDFISNVSHEFKTPINAIEGYTTLLQDSEHLSQEEQDQYINKILFNTKRLSTLVGNILLMSKIENQSIQANQTRFRLDEQIRQSIVLLEQEWMGKEIEFDINLEAIEIQRNEILLHHVWDNLIGNAIKFNPRYGLIRIRLRKQGENIIFEIEDSGPGISEEAKKHIFDKFYQADSSHKGEGNGLGLALVKRILYLSDGEITVENIQGGGCRFTVILREEIGQL